MNRLIHSSKQKLYFVKIPLHLGKAKRLQNFHQPTEQRQSKHLLWNVCYIKESQLVVRPKVPANLHQFQLVDNPSLPSHDDQGEHNQLHVQFHQEKQQKKLFELHFCFHRQNQVQLAIQTTD